MSFRLRYLLRGFLRTHLQAKSLLAVMCLGISIATLMLVLAMEAGSRGAMADILAREGSRNLTITAGQVAALPGRGSSISMATTLVLQDSDAIAQQRWPISAIAPVSASVRVVEYRELSVEANVTGTLPVYFDLRNFALASGRLPDATDNAELARVAVLGAQVAEVIFGMNQERVLTATASTGQMIRIGSVPFEVIGVLQARGSGQTGISQDDGIYIPLNTALRRVFNVDYLNSIVVQVDDVSRISSVRDKLTVLLRLNHQLAAAVDPDFAILDAARANLAAARNEQFANSFFRSVALLALGMSGVGIFAVNYLNVKERSSEFGLRRATGAGRADVALLVLAETLVLGIAGGLGGMLIGLPVLAGISAMTRWTLLLNATVLLQSLAAALLLSSLAALVPAGIAANESPVNALHKV